jgi:hypothetical protein
MESAVITDLLQFNTLGTRLDNQITDRLLEIELLKEQDGELWKVVFHCRSGEKMHALVPHFAVISYLKHSIPA